MDPVLGGSSCACCSCQEQSPHKGRVVAGTQGSCLQELKDGRSLCPQTSVEPRPDLGLNLSAIWEWPAAVQHVVPIDSFYPASRGGPGGQIVAVERLKLDAAAV